MNLNITPKEVYTSLNSNDDIVNIYKQIEEKEIREGGWAFHNYEHVKNVSSIAEKILRDLNFDEDTIYKCKIACLLHDVGAIQGKEGHTERSYEYAKRLFEEKGWIFEDSDMVLDAIRNHSAGFDIDNIIALSIILADKLDIKKSRISEAGKQVKGNRQYGHIEDIAISIKEGGMTVNFITDGNMDKKEADDYYFTAKVFKAIDAFSKRLNLRYNILMDDKEWNLDDKMVDFDMEQ